MSDDLDDLLRRAMKTLDDQVPSGYFEGLPSRTLARLGEDSSMQTTSTGTGSPKSADKSSPTGVPPQERDEDSGLHDIRSMASSAKMRISSKRITTSPPVDEDVLASSSGSWKAVALPEPARMVSLPDPETLEPLAPPKRESKKEIKERERASAKKIAAEAVAVETSSPKIAIPVAAPVAAKPDVAATPIIGARFAQQQKKSRTGLYAVIGLGLAAAAGGAFYVINSKDSEKQAAVPAVAARDEVKPQAQAVPVTATPPASAAGAGSAAMAAPEAPPATDTTVATGMAADDKADKDTAAVAGADRGAEGAKVVHKAHKGSEEKKAEPKDPASKDEAKSGADATKKDKKPEEKEKTDGSEPSFDQLLKEAGVQDKKVEKPKLEKKSLSGADIKAGMSSVAAKAQACYAGTQGTAAVKLTVGPDGTVQKVSVTGVFAGTPVGACVEGAVKGAKFPAWDGGPQSFGYSYLLAE